MSALPLQRIEGKYEILEKIREGGMGAIYKVRHRLLDEIRVVKLMRQQLVENEELKARFLREARLAIKLRHTNIAQLYDFTVDDDGTAIIVMEFIDGLTLEDVLAFHGPPPLGLALEIAQQSLRAIGYLHSKGLIHRDISPDNLMLTADTDAQPLVKLIDLGIAKIQGTGGESHLTQTGTFLGKIRYAPPEQFGADGASLVDSRGDLYSFGVVLYELLTARFPIQGKDPSSLIAGHLFRPPLDFAETDPAGRVPAELRAVVFKALAKNPDDRYATAAELARALGAFRSPEDVPEEALPKLLTRPFIRVGASSLADPGSTQERLDQNFDLAPTPSPGHLLHLAKTATPTPAHGSPQAEESAVREGSGTIELQPSFATALAGIEAALGKRDYSAAESLLYGAEATFGERVELSSLHERIGDQRRQDLEEKKREKELAERIAVARELAEREDFAGALEELRRAAMLDPDSADVSALIQETEAASERQRQARETAQVAALLASARQCLEARDLPAGLEALGRADHLDPDNAEVSALREQIETSISLQEEEDRRARDLDAAVSEIRSHLDRGDLDTAGALLDQAAARFGISTPLSEQRKRLEDMRQIEEERARVAHVQALVAEARELAAAERLDDALATLHQAADLAPDHSGVRNLTEEVQTALRWQAQERRRAAELAAAAAALENHLDRGELTKASHLLERTVVAHGDRGPLPELRTRLQTLRALAAEKGVEPEEASAISESTLQQVLESGEEERQGRSLRPSVDEEIPLPAPTGLDKGELIQRRESVAFATALRPAVIPRPAPWLRWGRWLGAGVALFAALVVIWLVWLRAEPAVRENPVLPQPAPQGPPQRQQPAAPAASPPAPTQEAVPVEHGLLVIDALPWAEVVRVEGLDGKPLEIGPNHFTPLALPVPTGRYQVVLKNPGSPEERRVSVSVVADGKGKSEPAFVVFNRVSAEEYFRGLGF